MTSTSSHHAAVDDGVLVFSIAMNGYRWAWRSCLRSQRRYAERSGFDYACVDLPFTVSPSEAAWLKLSLIIRALEAGRHRWILFLDADAEVRVRCPDFRRVATADHDVYMAHGHSGRLNSGVVMVRRSDRSLAFFRAIVADCEGAVPSEDAAPYENGHVIKHGKASPVVALVERRWNNTSDPDLDDHIRHFTGPMAARSGGDRRARMRRYRRLGVLRNAVLGLWTRTLPAGPLPARLGLLSAAAAARFGVFAPPCAGGAIGTAP